MQHTEARLSAAYSTSSAAFIEADSAQGALLTRSFGASGTALAARDGEAGLVLLRNVGSKPLRVHADLLAEGSNRAADAAIWHEVALYRTDSGRIAVALRCLRAGEGAGAVHRALVFDDMDGAATWLEQFDPAGDLSAEFDVSDPRLSTACVALKAASLRERADRLERAYRGLIGEVLFRLETEL